MDVLLILPAYRGSGWHLALQGRPLGGGELAFAPLGILAIFIGMLVGIGATGAALLATALFPGFLQLSRQGGVIRHDGIRLRGFRINRCTGFAREQAGSLTGQRGGSGRRSLLVTAAGERLGEGGRCLGRRSLRVIRRQHLAVRLDHGCAGDQGDGRRGDQGGVLFEGILQTLQEVVGGEGGVGIAPLLWLVVGASGLFGFIRQRFGSLALGVLQRLVALHCTGTLRPGAGPRRGLAISVGNMAIGFGIALAGLLHPVHHLGKAALAVALQGSFATILTRRQHRTLVGSGGCRCGGRIG